MFDTAALAAAGKSISLAHANWQAQSSTDLAALYSTAGFAPSSPDSSVIVHLSDIHINSESLNTPTIDDRLVNAINQLNPLPNELVVSGDLVQAHPMAAGSPRNQVHYELARTELQAGIAELTRFDSAMRRWLIPGNHDTDAFEVQPELWMEETGLPPYQRFEVAGVPVFLLNGRHSGDFDDQQREWLSTQFASIPPSQEIVVFVHQQSLMRFAIERGVKRDLVGMLAGRSRTVWVFSGHVHGFYGQTFVERGTLFVQTVVTTANPNAFNDGRNPGFSLICLANGRVVCRITRDVKTALFNLLVDPTLQSAQPFIWPFGEVPYPILALEEGSFVREDYEVYRKSWDTGTWLSYVEELIYRLPLSTYAGKATEVLVLGKVRQPAEVLYGFSMSGEEGTFDERSLPSTSADVFRIPIPEHLQGEPEVLFRLLAMEDRFAVDLTIGGWGLGSGESQLNSLEQWMSQHFKEIRNRGNAAMDACPAGDGVCNLLKYAHGLDPLTEDRRLFDPAAGPASGGLPRRWQDETGGQRRVGLRFPRRGTAYNPGVLYILEEADNLLEWRITSAPTEIVLGVDQGWEDVVLCMPVEEVPVRFYRLRVDLTAPLLP